MNTSRELPRYQSHKKVHALKIKAIEFTEDGSAIIGPYEPGYGTYKTNPGYQERFKGSASDMGYFVVYSDGYQSWSPTKPFEEGYAVDN